MFCWLFHFTCSPQRLAASKLLVASSSSSREKTRYGDSPITADLIVCGTRPAFEIILRLNGL